MLAMLCYLCFLAVLFCVSIICSKSDSAHDVQNSCAGATTSIFMGNLMHRSNIQITSQQRPKDLYAEVTR